MAEPFIGEIKMWGFDWAPKGWALCNGALISTSQYSGLFALLGVTYGGNGQTTFALPDLRGRVPVGASVGLGPAPPDRSAYPPGAAAGAESVTLMVSNLPQHNHIVQASTARGTTSNATGLVAATTAPISSSSTVAFQIYSGSWTQPTQIVNETVGLDGGTLAHDNMQPFAVVNFAIAMIGIFPSRS